MFYVKNAPFQSVRYMLDGWFLEYKVECARKWWVNKSDDGRGSQPRLSTPSTAVQGCSVSTAER